MESPPGESTKTQCRALPATESFVQLQLLDGGSFTASSAKLHAGVKNEQFRMYNWAFYIFSPALDRRILWDLGMTSDKADYSPFVQKFIWDEINPVGPRKSIEQQLLARNGLEATQVDTVVFSHAHFDHSRPIRDTFPQAVGYFGPGTKEHCSPGHLHDSSIQWDGRFFDPKNATENWEVLRGPWQKFGPFDHAMDLLGNGSFWVIQAPGHMPGNLCAAARLEDEEWVLLGSDCCHSRELFDGTYEFAIFDMPDGGQACLQADIPAAKDTVARIMIMEKELHMHVAFAHDIQWMKDGVDRVLMSLLGDDLREAVANRISDGQIV